MTTHYTQLTVEDGHDVDDYARFFASNRRPISWASAHHSEPRVRGQLQASLFYAATVDWLERET